MVDAEVRFRDLTNSFYNILLQMEPFGPENSRPVFVARGVCDSGYSRIVKDLHIKFSLRQDNILFNGIGFNMSPKFEALRDKQPVDIVFTLDENEWNGTKHLQLKMIDVKPSS